MRFLAAGFEVLINRSLVLKREGEHLRITGLDDIISTAWEWHKRRAQEKSRWKPAATIGQPTRA